MLFFLFFPFFIYASTNDLEKIEIVVTNPPITLVEPTELFIKGDNIKVEKEEGLNIHELIRIHTFYLPIAEDTAK